jgi:hypothetical protein
MAEVSQSVGNRCDRLPWMAEVSQSVGNRCDRLPWMAEVSQSVGNRCDRLPWIAAEIAPGNPRHFLHPWRSEVLEPPGGAPVKTWKVCPSSCSPANAKSWATEMTASHVLCTMASVGLNTDAGSRKTTLPPQLIFQLQRTHDRNRLAEKYRITAADGTIAKIILIQQVVDI